MQSCKTELVQDDNSALIEALDAKKTRFLVPQQPPPPRCSAAALRPLLSCSCGPMCSRHILRLVTSHAHRRILTHAVIQCACVRVQEQIKPIREQLHLTETTTFESIRRCARVQRLSPEHYTPATGH